jgi:hypothetical protein
MPATQEPTYHRGFKWNAKHLLHDVVLFTHAGKVETWRVDTDCFVSLRILLNSRHGHACLMCRSSLMCSTLTQRSLLTQSAPHARTRPICLPDSHFCNPDVPYYNSEPPWLLELRILTDLFLISMWFGFWTVKDFKLLGI